MDEKPDQEGNVSDDVLLANLRMAAAVREPVPASVLEAARAAFSWRLIDAELAELVADSVFETALAGTRGGQEPRLVTFEVPGGTALELEASPTDRGVRLVGQVVPARRGTAEVQHPGGSLAVEVDEVGRFSAHGIPRGYMRIRLRLLSDVPGGEPDIEIVTASLTI
ncbi:MAG TPA: hypothetical protein VET24_14610 [Actinomycetota bacterium]|nr:hypothetical protein [Actinomycetota bacterium]